jgi:hypothetical protein
LKHLADDSGIKPNEELRVLIDGSFLAMLKQKAARVNGRVVQSSSAEDRTLPLFPGLIR